MFNKLIIVLSFFSFLIISNTKAMNVVVDNIEGAYDKDNLDQESYLELDFQFEKTLFYKKDEKKINLLLPENIGRREIKFKEDDIISVTGVKATFHINGKKIICEQHDIFHAFNPRKDFIVRIEIDESMKGKLHLEYASEEERIKNKLSIRSYEDIELIEEVLELKKKPIVKRKPNLEIKKQPKIKFPFDCNEVNPQEILKYKIQCEYDKKKLFILSEQEKENKKIKN
jgi:hypothetical protein